MALRERLLAIGQSAGKQILENGDGKVVYKRAYYAGSACHNGCVPVERRDGVEAGKVTAGLARLIALSGIKEAFDEGRKWLQEYPLFEVSENTLRSETQKIGELQRQADQALVKAMQDEKSLQKRGQSRPAAPDILYGSIDAATPALAGGTGAVRIAPPRCAGKSG